MCPLNSMAHAEFLARHSGNLGVRLNQYDSDRSNLLINQAKASLLDGSAGLQLAESKWVISLEATRISTGESECIVISHCVAGETLGMSTWVETSLMLSTIEIPGLYVRPDLGLVVAFDHIRAEVFANTQDHLEAKLCNPTPLPAAVRVFLEQGEAVLLPLMGNHLYGCRVINLEPWASEVVRFSKSNS